MKRIHILGMGLTRPHNILSPSSFSLPSNVFILMPLRQISLSSTTTTKTKTNKTKRRGSFFKMGNIYTPGKFTSKDLPKGPTSSNQPWDPVYAHYAFNKVTGPLQRKQNTTPDDHLNVEELEKWMDAKSAAKVLGIKEEDLSNLTSPIVEEYFAKVYNERTNAQQQEVVIAAEVLLEYIDSTVHRKKSRQYYRQYIDNARQSFDHETELRRRDHRQKFIYFFGITMLASCTMVICMAFFRNIITRKDIENIGASAVSYLNMVFTQPSNPEPAPDYTSRYRNTPSAMTIDQQAGLYGNINTNSLQAQVAAEVENYHRREEAEMLKILNDENEQTRKETKLQQRRESRVRVYRPEDFDDAGELKEIKTVKEEIDPAKAFSQMSFREFANMMASQFGGGSRFQRITQDGVQRSEELQRMRERMEGTNKLGGEQ